MTWSLVSCSAARSPSRMWPVPREARIEPMTGLQMSQPRPRPCAATISLKVVRPCTRTTSKSLRPRQVEVLTQRVAHLDPGILEPRSSRGA